MKSRRQIKKTKYLVWRDDTEVVRGGGGYERELSLEIRLARQKDVMYARLLLGNMQSNSPETRQEP